MLSKTVLKLLSQTIWLASKFYAIPCNWNPTTQRFESQKRIRKLIGDNLVRVVDTVCRIWCIIAYGWMGYNYSKHESTMVQVLFPIGFVCCVSWCWNVKYVSHTYRIQFEQFVNGFLSLNDYLVKELKTEDKDMPNTKLFKLVIIITEPTSVLTTLTGYSLWHNNYLNLHAYVYWFGITRTKFLYDFLLAFWIFWNYLLFIYILLLSIYLISIYDWLKYIGYKFENGEIGLQGFLHYYKCIQTTNILFSRALGVFFLPAAFFLSQITLVVIAAFTLLFYSQISILPIYGALSVVGTHVFLLVIITKISSLITAASRKFLWKLKTSKLNARDTLRKERSLDLVREIRIYIGSFYFIDPGTLLVTLDIVIENLITLLLAYR